MGYVGPARPFIHGWKERGLRPLAPIAAALVDEAVPAPEADLITYIPADADRSVRRGDHPAERLARGLGRRWELEVRPLLERTRTVGRQTGLAREERRRNVRGAFRVIPGREPVPARVILVDDVYTTGATVSAAATALRAGGAREVHVVTFARTLR